MSPDGQRVLHRTKGCNKIDRRQATDLIENIKFLCCWLLAILKYETESMYHKSNRMSWTPAPLLAPATPFMKKSHRARFMFLESTHHIACIIRAEALEV